MLLGLDGADAARLPEEPVERYLEYDGTIPGELSEVRGGGPHVGVFRLEELTHHLPLDPKRAVDLQRSPFDGAYVRCQEALHRDLEGFLGHARQALYLDQDLFLDLY